MKIQDNADGSVGDDVSGGYRLSYSMWMNENPEPTAPPHILTRFARYVRGLVFRVFVYLFVYFVIAVLTIGPCFWSWFESTYVDGPKWIARFYAPLVWICDRIPILSWLVNLYVHWWIV